MNFLIFSIFVCIKDVGDTSIHIHVCIYIYILYINSSWHYGTSNEILGIVWNLIAYGSFYGYVNNL
jgi:hypothetical protein